MATESCYNFAKLQELARLECVSELSLRPALGRLTSADVPSFATAEHEHQASELLARGKISNSLLRTVRRLDSRTYTSITELLPSAIEQDETAGLAQALLRLSPGPEAIKKAEKREDQIRRREALLDEAVQKNNIAAVWLLAPACSQSGRDRALTIAVRGRKSKKIILKLLQYGADPGRCKEEFLEACQTGDHDLVATLLQGPSSISPMVLFDALTTATRSGDIQILSLLTQAADLSSARDLEAVSEAVRSARLDMLLRLLLSAKARDPRVLDHLIGVVFRMSGTEAAVRLRMLDALFYAGPSGETAASCLADAVSQELMAFVHIFIKHRVDINWSDGKAAVNAAQTGRSAVLKTVLAGRGLLAENASRALGSLPAYVPPEERRVITELLLDAGAHGSAVDHELILAVKRNDETAVDMLLQRGASVDRGGGKALIEAIKQERVALVHRVLSCPMNNESLSKAFPSTRAIQKAPRLDITKLMLKAGASGEAVDAALRDAVCDMSEDRDDILIAALIQGGADPAFRNAQSLRHAVTTHDVKLLRDLMRCPVNVSEGLASALLDDIMKLGERDIRYSMIQEAIRGRANISSVSNALIAELSRCTCDSGIIKLLLGRGRADVGHDGGKALVLAALQAHTDNLMLVLSSSTVSCQSVEKGLCAMLESRKLDDGQKAARAEIILERTKPSETSANAGFSSYVKFCKSAVSKGREWPLETFKVLVRFGADINTDNGSTFASIVEPAAIPLMTYILSSATLRKDNADRALLCCVGLPDTCDRSEALRTLLGCRPTNEGASIALIEATRRGFVEVVQPLLQYGAMADFQDDAPIREAASRGNATLLSLFLEAKVARRSLRAAFQVAAQLVHPESRFECIKTILSAGLRGDVVDLYLVGLVRAPATSIQEIKLLLDHEASVHAHESQSLIVAATSKSVHLLRLLFTKAVAPESASLCFQACLAGQLIQSSKAPILEFLLEKGVDQHLKDAALLQAVEGFLSTSSACLSLMRMLVQHGAKADLADGQALCRACEAGSIDAVVAILQASPSLTGRTENDILCWAMSQSDPRIKTECLQVLIQHGANVNYRDPNTKETLLLLAMRTGRIALMKSLVAAGVDVSAANDRGHSPLLIAIELGSDVIAETLIEAGANPNDGSLHQAARALQPKLLKALLRHGANPNYHSRVHGGRTPLAEVCVSAKVTSSSYQDAIVVFTELVKSGADIEKRVDRKPLICIALDNPDPVMAVQALISTCLSEKRIDDDFNLYEQGGMMYSPTYYVFKGVFQGQQTQAGELVELLLRYGANRDVYYSLRGPQPPDAVGMPAPIAEKEAKRLARAERIAEEEADHRRKMQRADEEEARLRRIEQQQHALRYERNEELATQTLQHARLMNLVEQERKAGDIAHEQSLRKIRWQRGQDRLQLQQSEYEEVETHRERLCIMDMLAIQQRRALELQNRRDFDEVEREAIKYKASIVEELAEREHGRKTELLALMSTGQLGLEEPDGGGYIEGLEESESESE
ncbi:hypothetical protein HRR90_003039 [Exophiala dermatitidis]|nr:hypothetical protein HRR88_005205 [Exophiala dermatitidis]KAJ4656689.1 hypothetical protein HRR90_003039 [Exophiala dermatitidis]KAJ4664658.1 hypothetical protein HRR95_008883 [Exophiala dermatitidis]